MSRSGYSDDAENIGLYRANVERSIRGKRGQAFLREMIAALDAMPTKELIAEEIVRDNEHVCAIGSVAVARELDVSELNMHDSDEVGGKFGISSCLAAEIAYHNDELDYVWRDNLRHKETSAERWMRMRAWADGNLIKQPSNSP